MAESGFRGAWQHRQWRALLASYAISGIGDWLFFTAFAVWIYERTHSAAWLAAASTARLILYVVGSSFGGRLAGRLDRRRLMVACDLARMVVMVAIAILMSQNGPPAVALAMTAVSTVATIPYRPAVAAATVHVVAETSLAAANGAEAVVNQFAVFIGPAFAALLISQGSPAIAVGGNAVSFGLSAAFVAVVRSAGGGEPSRADAHDGATDAASTSAWSLVLHPGPLATLTALTVASIFMFGTESVLHVLIADRQLHAGPAFVGVMTAAVGIGGVVAAPISGRLAATHDPGRWLIMCAIAQGLPLMLLGIIHSRVVAVLVLGVEGVGVIVFEVLAITLLQRLAGKRLAELFGVQDSLTAGGQLLGGVLAPVLVAVAGLGVACAVGGGALVAMGVLGAGALLRCGAAGRPVTAVAARADALHAVGLLEGASRAAVERLAADVTEQSIAAGATVIVEGAPADALYLIRSGAFHAASAANGFLREMTTGDWFGEIGVLTGQPRSASVVAESAGVVWRIPADSFRAALLDLAIPGPLAARMHARLGEPHHELEVLDAAG